MFTVLKVINKEAKLQFQSELQKVLFFFLQLIHCFSSGVRQLFSYRVNNMDFWLPHSFLFCFPLCWHEFALPVRHQLLQTHKDLICFLLPPLSSGSALLLLQHSANFLAETASAVASVCLSFRACWPQHFHQQQLPEPTAAPPKPLVRHFHHQSPTHRRPAIKIEL